MRKKSLKRTQLNRRNKTIKVHNKSKMRSHKRSYKKSTQKIKPSLKKRSLKKRSLSKNKHGGGDLYHGARYKRDLALEREKANHTEKLAELLHQQEEESEGRVLMYEAAKLDVGKPKNPGHPFPEWDVAKERPEWDVAKERFTAVPTLFGPGPPPGNYTAPLDPSPEQMNEKLQLHFKVFPQGTKWDNPNYRYFREEDQNEWLRGKQAISLLAA